MYNTEHKKYITIKKTVILPDKIFYTKAPKHK